MTADPTARMRHYLLGDMSEEEHLATEQRYFSDDSVVDELENAEEALIEDYLGGQLSADERSRFERVYLSTPGHRRRVETIRQLSAFASPVTQASAPATAPATVSRFPSEPQRAVRRSRSAARPSWVVYGGLAAAAAVLLAVGLVWSRNPATSTPPPPTVAQAPAPASPDNAPQAPAPAAPPIATIFAVSLSPIQVRGAGETPTVTMPPEAELLELRLEGETIPRPENGWRVSVRTVNGDEVWQGTDVADSAVPSGVVARVQVPAARVPPDDYVVSLAPAGGQGSRPERYRYFLRVQGR